MRHRHHHISRETPTLCTTQSRGFVFILRSFAPSALDVASKVEQHRKATAALLLPSAALEPKVERMWSVQAAVQIAQRREVGRSSPSRSLSAQFSLSNSSLAVTRGGGSRFSGPSSSFARRALSSKSWPFLPKSCVVRVEISRLFSRRCGAASHLSVFSRHSAWWCAKKSPAVCLTAGECRLRHAPQGA